MCFPPTLSRPFLPTTSRVVYPEAIYEVGKGRMGNWTCDEHAREDKQSVFRLGKSIVRPAQGPQDHPPK